MTEAVREFKAWLETRETAELGRRRVVAAGAAAGECATGLAGLMLGLAACAPGIADVRWLSVAPSLEAPLATALAILAGAILAEALRRFSFLTQAAAGFAAVCLALIAAFGPEAQMWPLMLLTAAAAPLAQTWRRRLGDVGGGPLLYGAFAGGVMLALATPLVLAPVAGPHLLAQIWPIGAAGAGGLLTLQLGLVVAQALRGARAEPETARIGWALTRYVPAALAGPLLAWGIAAALG